jgi:hypothetical protein
MAVPFLVFGGASILFSIVVVLICLPTSSGVHFSLQAHQHLLLVVLLMVAVLTGVRWYLNVVLICISFMARDGEHFFMCSSAIWIFSYFLFAVLHKFIYLFEKALFSSFAYFFIGA